MGAQAEMVSVAAQQMVLNAFDNKQSMEGVSTQLAGSLHTGKIASKTVLVY